MNIIKGRSGTLEWDPEQVSSRIPGLTACAKQVPTQLCVVPENMSFGAWATLSDSTNGHWGVSLTIFIIMLMENLVNTTSLDIWAQRMPDKAARRFGFLYKHVWCVLAEVWLVINVCQSVIWFVLVLPFTLDTTKTAIWPLGQIVAVAIWVPSVFEYLYLLYRKFQTTLPTQHTLKHFKMASKKAHRTVWLRLIELQPSLWAILQTTIPKVFPSRHFRPHSHRRTQHLNLPDLHQEVHPPRSRHLPDRPPAAREYSYSRR